MRTGAWSRTRSMRQSGGFAVDLNQVIGYRRSPNPGSTTAQKLVLQHKGDAQAIEGAALALGAVRSTNKVMGWDRLYFSQDSSYLVMPHMVGEVKAVDLRDCDSIRALLASIPTRYAGDEALFCQAHKLAAMDKEE